MRILNVDVILCDRCARRFEIAPDNKELKGYGTVVLRAMRAESVDRGGDLSPREQRILILIAQGMSNKLIARELDSAEATVKVHIKSILRKTRCRNRTQAAMMTRSHGPEQVTAKVEMTADLCDVCVEELRVFMRHGSETKQVAA